tara:strand:- start:666 stop:1046 length:381 start_codon:yes stop_codon:yes gene_type:complete
MIEHNTPIHNKLQRLLKNGWSTREELAEEMYLSEDQITGIIARLRSKGIIVISRPSLRKNGYAEYSLGKKGEPFATEYSTRSVNATKNLLITEMNRIRIEAKKLNVIIIEEMAIRALQASGVNTTD